VVPKGVGLKYDDERVKEQLRILEPELIRFVQDYKPGQPTLILLPGGLGSAIERAEEAFHDGDPPADLDYDDLWLAPSMLCDAMELAMADDIDADNHICIADGPIAILGLNPYGRFKRWCDDNDFNHFVLGWDWRRRLAPTVDFLTNQFLPTLYQRVDAAYSQDPLDGFTLIGHSEGGFVVKLFLGGGSSYVQQMAHAITIATPFYGYGGQLQRYFSGDDYFNPIYGKMATAQLVATMRGGYVLLFTDIPTFQRDMAKLNADLQYPPPDWPCKDLTTGAPVDPYAPGSQPGKFRYPTGNGNWFLWGELTLADLVRQQITSPLPDAINAKFYNFRGVQTDNGQAIDGTKTALTWDWVNANFDPDVDPSPLADLWGKGDDTIPAWSARLVSTPAANVVPILGDVSDLNHVHLMEHDDTLQQIGAIVAPGQPLVQAFRKAAPPAASRVETIRFLKDVRDAAGDRKVLRALLAKYDYHALQGFVRRFLTDMKKGPSGVGTAKRDGPRKRARRRRKR